MSSAERREVWRRAQRGEYTIVIGPRSAVFAPVRNLGLIVVDEEHEASYKQFDASPRYHARDIAAVRGSLESAVVVLGSATPSVESYMNARTGKYNLLELRHRIDDVPMPAITIVDMTLERKRAYSELKESLPAEARTKLKDFQQSAVSALLRAKIQDRLERREGIILLQNRRGFAPFVECPECGYNETCENCNVTLTYHLTKKHLRCHYCGFVRQPYILCPKCGGSQMKLQGIGTQRVEQDLTKLFPSARILRMDLDTTTKKGAHDRILKKFGTREADILLGTQMVAKGLDFPHVTLVGVISADTQMLLPDFRSAERTFQLLTQVAGRAGRSNLLGEVIIQTRQPRHYTLAHVVDHNFTAFYDEEVAIRQELDYPPFSRLVLIEAKGEEEVKVRKTAEQFALSLKATNGFFSVLGPAPAVIEKIKSQYRWHIIIKNAKSTDPAGHRLRQALQKAKTSIESTRKQDVRLIVDVDPGGLM
jgi:primosomal protein N' (replication factor Y)